MNNEEMQRTMEFILGQQAQFAANMQRLEEERSRDTPRLARLEESFQGLVALAEITDAKLDRVESSTSTLEANVDKLVSGTGTLEANMAILAESQAHTDERLRSLIELVSRGP